MRDISEISILRGPCMGECPIDTATLLSSGNLLYAGEDFVTRIGHYHSKFWKGHWKHLCQLIEEAGFFDLDENISGIDDFPFIVFRVVAGEQTKEVSIQAIEWPYQLWLLNVALAGFLNIEQRQWQAENSGLRGRFKHPPRFPDKPREQWQEWEIPKVIVDRLASPSDTLPVDTRVMFHVPVDESGSFSLPLRPGRYQVSQKHGSPAEQIVVRPNAWQKIEIRNK